jgi:hypothetical protein
VPANPDQLLSEFIDAWNAGRRPDVDAHLARVPEADRGALAADIAGFLAFAPTPAYDDDALLAIRAEPVVRAAAAGPGLWPALVPRLRERAALSTAELAVALVGLLELPAGAEPKTRGYLERLERGELEPRALSGRVLDGLARLLAVPRAALEGAALAGSRPATLFRAEGAAADALRDDLDVLADALAAPAGADWDEVDELFRGGAR